MGRIRASKRRKKPRPPEGKAAAVALAFEPGADVEVRIDDDGFHGSWFEATVVSHIPGSRGRGAPRYDIYYSSLLSDAGGPLFETVLATHIRPRPPPSPSPSPPSFSLQNIVEAFHNDGWWSGIIISSFATAEPSYTVAFPITREVISFSPSLIRPRLDFVDGNWVPSQDAVAIQPSYSVRTYTAGEKVEVVRHRETYGYSWFPATVTKAIGKMSYLVEYYGLEADGKAVTEFLHWQFIRPAVKHCPPEGVFKLGPSSKVEVFRDGAWSPAVVLEVVGKSEYEVSIEGTEAQLVLTCAAAVLKPRYKWNGKRWILLSPKRQANLKRQSISGTRSSSPVDVASSDDDEYTHDPESHAKKRLRKESLAEEGLQPTQGIASTEDSGHASKSDMDTPLRTLRKLVSEKRLLKSCSPLSTKNYLKVLSERILTTSAAPREAPLDLSSGQPTPLDLSSGQPTPQNQKSRMNGGKEPSVVNQESRSDSMLSDDHLNTSDHEANSNEAHDMLSIAELRKRKIVSCGKSNAFQQKGEMVLPVQALQGNKEASDIVQVQLDRGTNSGSSKEILCGLSTSIECETSLALEKQKETPDVVQIQLDEVANSGSNIEISHVLSISKESAKQKHFEGSYGQVNSSDHEATSDEAGGMMPIAGLKWKRTSCRTTSTLQQKGRKKLTVLSPGRRKEAPDKIQLEKESRSSTVQRLDRTSKNHLNRTEVPCQDLSPDVPPLCNKKAVSCVNSTFVVNAQNSLECSGDGVCEVNRQASLLEDSMTAVSNGVSQVNRQLNVFKDGMTSMVTEINPLMENSTNMHTGTTGLLSFDCQVQQDGGKAEERPILPPSQNTESIQDNCIYQPLGKSVVESFMVPPSPLDLLSGKQLSFLKSSPMWGPIEAMDVFCKVPQRPHFLPLLQYLPTLREGIALGLMISFANLLESIGKLHIEDSTALFKEKMGTLTLLEANGFNVQILQSRLNKLLQIKTGQTEHKRERKKLEEQILVKKADASRINALIDAKHEAILDLEQKLELLRVEKETLAKQKACEDAELSRLEMEGSEVHEACENAERHFYNVLAEPW